MSRRDQIQMTADEVSAFLAQQRVLICATNGREGWPHLMPLWYVLRDEELWSWTYARSQKVRNLERDDRATVQVESGHEYRELRGVMIRARCRLHRSLEMVSSVGGELAARYGQALEVFERQAPKRVALQFVAESTASWDHRKLGDGY